MAADRRAEALHGAVDDRLAVDRVADGAAHADVVEGLLAVVDGEDRLALGLARLDREAPVGPQPAQRLGRADVGPQVDVAGEQRGDLRRRIADEGSSPASA
jgi:hypothetical protein